MSNGIDFGVSGSFYLCYGVLTRKSEDAPLDEAWLGPIRYWISAEWEPLIGTHFAEKNVRFGTEMAYRWDFK